MVDTASHAKTGAAAPKHYFALDALRGVAALVVVVLHEQEGLASLPNPASGYLAVDLFFLLSGFVIASAYDKRLAAGMGLFEFMKVRLIRLYPLYLLGLSIGLTRTLIQFQVGTMPPPAGPFALGTVFEFLLIPTPMTMDWAYDTLFFLNPPAWSLFYELLINLVFAALHRFLSRRVLVAAILAMAGGLVWVALSAGSLEVGNFWRSALISVPRVAFPFLLGVWLHRHGPKAPAWGNGVAWAAMAFLLLTLSLHPTRHERALYDLGMVMVVFPLLVWLCSGVTISGVTRRLATTTGEMSYAVYILHMPTFGVILAVLRRVAPEMHLDPVAGPVFVAGVALACLAADHFYDKPVRRWLSARLIRRASQPVRWHERLS